ncbi:hypothetical protein HU230_0032725 [Bradyrhizobium quebecense]|uniref:Uncharacterized protein n=1 Tax=Bradyrhizobium quebecense TaxID=2748629 RepID=A0A973WXS3_9BRAD|nr:hypothetical protein [Bradyrhizobium quebecense]UGA43006.1 hypothetical protein HU230_0032725 [Bradyrhizobium quebecense]
MESELADITQLIFRSDTKKIDRPPFVHNWVRFNHPTELSTVKSIVSFMTGTPQISYAAGQPIIRDRIALKLDRDTALKAALNNGHKKSRPYVAEYVNAFYDYDDVRNYSGKPSYDQYVAPYSISRDTRIPVKPLIVISEAGVLKPIFIVGWATMPLTLFQRRLLMTVLEDAVFSLTDFQDSPGEFICFPRAKGTGSGRYAEVWNRGDFVLLTESEMKDQTELYLRALATAKSIVAGTTPTEAPSQTERTSVDQTQTGDLFGKRW